MEIEELRTCKQCGIIKLKTTFPFHLSTGYYKNTCHSCMNENDRMKRIPKFGRREGTLFIRQKKCGKCESVKDLNFTNFRKSGRNFSKICRECHDKFIKEKRGPVQKGHLLDSATKKCKTCQLELSILNFYYSQRRYHSHCMSCESSNSKKRRKAESEEERIKRIRESTINRELNRDRHLLVTYNKFDFERNFETDLTREYIKENLYKKCTYCNHPSTGLDRIDNAKGHLQSNCIPCCWECNTARMNNFSYDEMLIIGKAIKQIKDNRNQI